MDAVQQRGQTAVLGSASLHTSLSPRFALDVSSSAYNVSSSSSRPADPIRSRAIARRKQQRKDNAGLAYNPHVVRPSPRDYAIKHNEHAPSFPIPGDLQRIFSATTGVSPVARQPHPDQGGLRMSYSDAHWFLANRVGVQLKEEGSSGGGDTRNMSSGQRFAKTAESEIIAWLSQDVFLRPEDGGSRVLFEDNVDEGQVASPLLEVSRNPHSLIWQIADPFKRLTVHCLARVYGCATLSKDSSAHPSSADVVRQTWILKSRAQQLQDQQRRRSITLALGLETPPTTDVGTDVASAVHSDSDWTGTAMSDVDEGALSDGDQGIHSGIDDNDVTPYCIVPHRFHSTLPEDDDEDDHFADVES